MSDINPFQKPESDVTVSPSLAVSYRCSYFDLNWFSLRTLFTSVKMQIYLLIICIAFAYVLTLSGNIRWIFISTGAVLLYLVMWITQIVFTMILLATKKNKSMLSDQLIELHQDGLIEKNEFQELKVFWRGVIRVVDAYQFVAIYFTDLQAVVIPNRAFRSQEHRDQFINYIRGKINDV